MDDFETIISRRRTRKPSSTSTATRHANSPREDGDLVVSGSETRGRAVSFSRNIRERSPTSPSISTGPGAQSYSSSRSIHSLRARRARTSSLTSSASLLTAGTNDIHAPVLLFQNSQSSLEKVVRSRLVETLVTIAAPAETTSGDQTASPHHSTPSQRALSTALRSAPIHQSNFNSLSPPKRQVSKILLAKDTERKMGKGKLVSTTNKRDVLDNLPPAISKPHHLIVNGASDEGVNSSGIQQRTVYCSRTHRPSTNPIFPFDFNSQSTSSLAGFTGHRLIVEIWGRDAGQFIKEDYRTDHRPRPLGYDLHQSDWRKLDDWDVDLRRLVPVPESPVRGLYLQEICSLTSKL